MTNTDLLFFNEDKPVTALDAYGQVPWKIIVADDEEEVHIMTKMVMRKFEYEGRGVQLLTAYSGEETCKLMRDHDDIAIVLLDVVMETENSGLEVVKYIRDELSNPFVRIILRTGQPGQAPQDDVIRHYDINDYKSKTELTVQKLYTAVIASLRSYTDMRVIDKNRRGLELILNQSRELYNMQDINAFDQLMLMHYQELLAIETGHKPEISGMVINYILEDFLIGERFGRYENMAELTMDQINDQQILTLMEVARKKKDIAIGTNSFVAYYTGQNNLDQYLYISTAHALTEGQRNLIKIYTTNAMVAYANASLNNEIIETQKEIILTLGEIVETRSKETANHVVRVAEYCYLLASLYGLTEEEAELLKMASPMHDIGKVGIPDHILNKPGKLTIEEFEIIKTHSLIGYEVLSKSKRNIMQTAAQIALSHHEKWDGTGYPKYKKGTDIDVFSRITSLADVFDALSHKRVYKEAWPEHEVIAYIESQSGKMFDPDLVDLFLENIDAFKHIKNQYPDWFISWCTCLDMLNWLY